MSILETRMQNLIVNNKLDKNEIRPSRYGAFELFKQSTDSPLSIITEEMKEKAKSSIGRLIQVPVIADDETIKITNTRTITIDDHENTTHKVDVTFSTLTFNFTQVPSNFMNNEISAQKDFEAKFLKRLYLMGKKLDEMAITALEAAKTKVIADPLIYPVAGGTVTSKFSERGSIFGDVGSIMGANDYFGQLQIVGNAGVESTLRTLAQSDTYNAVNKRNEYAGKAFYFSNALKNEADTYATAFAVEEGQVGILYRFEREAVVGRTLKNGTEFGTTNLPILDIPCGTYYTESVVDASGMAGEATQDNTRAYREAYSFSVDVAFMVPYNSAPDTKANPILAFDIKRPSEADAIQVVNVTPGTGE